MITKKVSISISHPPTLRLWGQRLKMVENFPFKQCGLARVVITGVAGYRVMGSNYFGERFYFEFEPSHFEALGSALENLVYFVNNAVKMVRTPGLDR